MNFAKKLKEVVASNFIEIAKTEEEQPAVSAKATPEIDRATTPSYMETPPVTFPAVPTAPLSEMAADNAPISRAPIQVREVTPQPVSVAPPEIVAPPVAVAPVVEAPAPVVKTEPIPVVEVPAPPPEPVLRRPLVEQVAPYEAVSIDAIFREAPIPQIPFTAEQAAKVLFALPADLPLQVKRLTVKATMEAVERTRVIEPQELVADAMLKKAHIYNYREEFRGHVESLHQETDMEIDRLKAEIDRLTALKAAADRKLRSLENIAAERIVQMEQVVVFFQSEVAQEMEHQSPQRYIDEDEELPPFMRDDSVLRMLGMEESDDSAVSEPDSPPVATNGSRSRTSGRFAVAENSNSGN